MPPNGELRCLYSEVWKQLENLSLPTDGTLSMPFFLRIPEGYETAKLRLVVVGQQTRGWGRVGWGSRLPGDPDDSIEWLQHEYADTLRDSQSGHFWRAVRQLQEKLRAHVPPNGFVWANVFPMDRWRRIPDMEVQKKLVPLGVLAREMKILQPDAVVFFIGPYYRGALKLMFPNVQITEAPTRESPIVALRASDSSLPHKSYWTYHPRGLYYQGKGILDSTLEGLASLIRQ